MKKSTRTLLCLALTVLLAAGALSAQTTYTATLEESQVVGGTGSTATGTATLTLNAAGDTLTYSITLVGLDLDGLQTPADPADNVNNMHFHGAAPPGANAGVVFGLIGPDHDPGPDPVINPVAGTLTGAWDNLDTNPLSGQLANLQASLLYLNVHTTAFPGGEIRGQVEPVPPSLIEVPTLGGLGFAALALLLAGAGFFALRRRSSV